MARHASHQTSLIIDANALLHRSFHALPPTLTTADGQMVNAVYGFTTVLLKVLKEFKPTHIAVAFDKAKKTFRHEQFTEYKAGRAETPDEFYSQIPIVKEMLAVFGIPVFELDGYEADDVIGTIVTLNTKEGIRNIIVTGDKDAFQLIDDNTSVYTMRKGMSDTVLFDTDAFKEKYGLAPKQMIDFKAIAGDPSDNIPGVRGIGEKGATELLKAFPTLEAIYEAVKQGEQSGIKPRYLKLLTEHEKDARMSKELATIVCDTPIKYQSDAAKLKTYDKQAAYALFKHLEFKSLVTRLPEFGETPAAVVAPAPQKKQKDVSVQPTAPVIKPHRETQAQYTLINTDADFADLLAQLEKQKCIAVDTESTSVDPFRATLLGISVCWKPGVAYYLNVKDHPQWIKKLKTVLEDESIKKVGHNIKYDLAMLWQVGINLQPIVFDSMVASYLLNPGSRGHSLDDLAYSIFGYEMQPITDLIGKGKGAITMDLVPLDHVSWYAAEDADYTWQLYEHFQTELKEKELDGLMKDMEVPLIPVLARLEQNGVQIDADFLEKLSRETGKKIEKLERGIYELAGVEFNINSPAQLKEVLFERLKISTEGIGKTKTGLSTAAAELEKLHDRHPLIPLIQEYRELAKLKSTYLDALPLLVNPKTGRIHTSFNQTVAATGRLSSSDPNFQNIPIRTEEGRRIREAFIASPGFSIVAADYSQIELRIVASIAGDEKMIASFRNGEDIHSRTAADVNQIPLEQVTKQQRYEAKEVNFGILYGMGAWGLAARQGMSRERARAFIEKYFMVHPEIQEYMATTIALAHEQGYVETLFGRRRYLPDINASMQQVRAAAERMAINMPIQGTAADLLKVAMIRIDAELPQLSPKAKMILQVHDELVFEVPTADVEKVGKFIAEKMNTAYTLNVPIVTEVEAGPNWGALTPLDV
ncbi:MAG: DNA polymerase I [Candidatus Kerfeldbacteria bacterium]|nr:DNA polymerase I [Candidatus Kerfeldbacteria bacterium]